MNDQNTFIGRGWIFPPEFDKDTGVLMEEGAADIKSSLRILFSTLLGERIMQPKFGCALDRLQFEPVTAALTAKTEDLIRTAILYHENRIKVVSVDISNQREPGLLEISLTYIIKAVNTRDNMVYPFYLQEGTTGSASSLLRSNGSGNES